MNPVVFPTASKATAHPFCDDQNLLNSGRDLLATFVHFGDGAKKGPWRVALDARWGENQVAILLHPPNSLCRVGAQARTISGGTISAIFQAIEGVDSAPRTQIRESLQKLWSRLVGAGYVHSPPYLFRPSGLPSGAVYDFAIAFQSCKIPGGRLRCLAPVYLGSVASFVADALQPLDGDIERLCLFYERWKPYLIEQ